MGKGEIDREFFSQSTWLLGYVERGGRAAAAVDGRWPGRRRNLAEIDKHEGGEGGCAAEPGSSRGSSIEKQGEETGKMLTCPSLTDLSQQYGEKYRYSRNQGKLN